MADNVISRNGLDERDRILCLKISQRVLDPPNHLEITLSVLQLRVNVNLVRNLAESFTDKQNVPFLDCVF